MIRTYSSFCTYFLVGFILVLASCDSSSPTLPTMEEEEMIPTPTEPTTPITDQSTIAFYNVENLFDTEDDPENSGDNEFLPSSSKAWTPERYEKKLNNIAAVVQGLNFPILLGLSEVENKKVLEDLINTTSLQDQSYEIVHKESPDHRGIDVALLYQAGEFTVKDWSTYEVTIDDPSIANYTTREILQVSGEWNNTSLYILVNHWPSRSGGQAQTEFRRITVAERLAGIVKDIQEAEPAAKIIIMGDFNDEPTDKSLSEVLNVQLNKDPLMDQFLYNCTSNLDEQNEGSYNYQGNWQMLDQIIVSGNLLDKSNTPFVENFQVYKADDLFFTHPEYGLTPDRTYGGDTYYGGYSDHLPVFVEVGN